MKKSIPAVIALTGAVLALAACSPSQSEGASQSSAASASPVAQVAESSTTTATRISADSALVAAQAALEHCRSEGVGFVTVAVVDRAGQVHALVRGDNAAAHTIEAATQKAYTAAAFGANTSVLAERATGEGPTIADLPGTLFLGGGVPVRIADASVAGIGVGGAPSGDVDESCAIAGLEAIAETQAG